MTLTSPPPLTAPFASWTAWWLTMATANNRESDIIKRLSDYPLSCTSCTSVSFGRSNSHEDPYVLELCDALAGAWRPAHAAGDLLYRRRRDGDCRVATRRQQYQ